MPIEFGQTTLTSDEGTKVISGGESLDFSAFENQQDPNVTNQLQSAAPTQSMSIPFSIDLDQEITSDALVETTPSEVFNQRAQAEATFGAATDATGALSEIETGIGTDVSPTGFDNFDSIIKSQLFGEQEPTATQTLQQGFLADTAERTGKIGENLDFAQSEAEERFGIGSKEALLADTNNRIAQKTKALRENIRAFGVDAERRGVARNFYQGELDKMEADATAELADEYIIQAAQSGNLSRAEGLIQTAVDNRYRSFEIQNTADKARLDALLPTLQGEEKQKALQLQFALNERDNDIAKKKEEAAGIRQFAITAAQNGASSNDITSILNSGSMDEALQFASPYIGLLERQKAASTIANAALSRRKDLVELALSGDKQAIAELGDYGQTLSNYAVDSEDAQRERDYLNAESQINIANDLLANDIGLGLATGSFTSPAAATFGVTVPAGVSGGAALGSVVPGLGTAIGAGGGLLAGLATGAYTYSQANNAKEDFLSDVAALVAPQTLDELTKRKAEGATFGALSDTELSILAAASSRLSGNLRKNSKGEVIRLAGSEENNRADIQLVIESYREAQDTANSGELSNDEFNEIKAQ